MANRGFWHRLTYLIAFIALICIGIALILGRLNFLGDVASALDTIAFFLALFVVAFVSYFYAAGKTSRHRLIFIISWAAAVIVVIVFKILSL